MGGRPLLFPYPSLSLVKRLTPPRRQDPASFEAEKTTWTVSAEAMSTVSAEAIGTVSAEAMGTVSAWKRLNASTALGSGELQVREREREREPCGRPGRFDSSEETGVVL